jgi:glutathione S-transferase
MLKLLGRFTSGNVQKVVFALEELKLPYERQDYGRQFNNTQTPEYGALNPTRKVPTLIDGDLAIWESHTILRYLAAKTGSGLYPTDPVARTQVDRWLDWQLASLNAPYVAAFLETRKAEAERNPDITKPLLPEVTILEGELGKRPYVAGAAFSIADIAYAPLVRRILAFPYAMPATPNLIAWRDRVATHPGFAAAAAGG